MFVILPHTSTGSPRYMRPFYLRFRVCAIEKWPFSWNRTYPHIYSYSWFISSFFYNLLLAKNATQCVSTKAFIKFRGLLKNILTSWKLYKTS